MSLAGSQALGHVVDMTVDSSDQRSRYSGARAVGIVVAVRNR